MPDVPHRIEQLPAHEVQGRPVVEHDVVERVREDLSHPHEASLHVLEKEQVDRAEDETAEPDGQPHQGDIVYKLCGRRMWFEQPEQARVKIQDERRCGPDRHQHDLALQVVTDLDLFLVLVRRVVDLVVVPGLEEEVTNLPACHPHNPCQQHGGSWILEDEQVCTQKARSTQQV